MNNSIFATISRFRASIPVDIRMLILELNIEYQEIALAPDISGLIKNLGGGRYSIQINKDHPETRKRFTAAHELGHYVYHRHLIGDGVTDNIAYRSENTNGLFNSSIGIHQEREANSFAANLLMPEGKVRAEYDNNENDFFSMYSYLHQTFGVSEQAMNIRLRSLGL